MDDSSVDSIAEKLTVLHMAVLKKDEDPLISLESLLSEMKDHGDYKHKDAYNDIDLDMFSILLQSPSIVVKSRTADLIATLGKEESFREKCSGRPIISWLSKLMQKPASINKDNIEFLTHICRAIGNLCYQNKNNGDSFTANNGLKLLFDVIRFSCTFHGEGDELSICGTNLRSSAVGLLLNYVVRGDEFNSKAIDAGIVDLLTDVLNAGTAGQHECNAGIHALIILGSCSDILGDQVNPVLTEKLCHALVKTLKECPPGELTELCIELAYTQTEYPTVAMNLAKAGLVELLMDLIQQYENMSRHSDFRNLFKMACDLIILIVNDDESMKFLYDNGKGKVFEKLVEWMSHSNDDIQVVGVLAIGNFARTDSHCTDIVKRGLGKQLMKLLLLHNTESGDLKYQHALLSALRNLVITPQNKSGLINDGLLGILYPMLSVTSFPVVFKLLGTLRLAVDGQEKAACEMGRKRELIEKLVEWCAVKDHPGVQGEATRLLSWIIKNSKNRDVMGLIVECKGVPCLVEIITSRYTVMQNEGLIALSLLSVMRLMDAEQTLLESNIGEKLHDLILKVKPKKEVFINVLTLVSQLCTSGSLKAHLRKSLVHTALTSYVKSADNVSDLKDQVARLTSMIDSG